MPGLNIMSQGTSKYAVEFILFWSNTKCICVWGLPRRVSTTQPYWSSGLCCHLGPWCHLGLSCSQGPCLATWPYNGQSQVWFRGSCCHQGMCGSPGTGMPPEFIMVSEGHAVAEAIQVWVACVATPCHGDI